MTAYELRISYGSSDVCSSDLVGRAYDHPLDIDTGQMDTIGIKCARGHHFFDLDHADPAASGGGQVEIARGLAEHEVAGFVGLPRLDDRQVGEDAVFQDVVFRSVWAVKGLHFLALSHQRADACLGVEAGDTRAACAHPFGQRALRAEFDLKLS